MSHAITLLLDEDSEAQVRALWKVLDDAGVPSLAAHGHLRHHPHVTLVVFDDGDPAAIGAAAGAALARQGAIGLRYGGHGVFHGPRCVVHLPVTTSAELRGAHAAMMEVLERGGATCWPYYEPDLWLPHVTLAMDILPWQAGAASAALVKSGLPPQARAVRMALVEVETGATREIARLA